MPGNARAAFERDDLRAASETRAQRRRQVDAGAAGIGAKAARLRFWNGQAQARNQLLCLRQLGAAHAFEVGVLQQLALRKSETGVDFDFLLLFPVLRLLAFGVQRVRQAPARLRRFGLAGAAVNLRQQQAHDALEHLRIAPENVEGLIEQFPLLALGQEHRRQRPVKVLAPLDASGLQCAQRIYDPVRADGQPGRAQHAGEVHDVLSQFACSHRSCAGDYRCAHSLRPAFRRAIRLPRASSDSPGEATTRCSFA